MQKKTCVDGPTTLCLRPTSLTHTPCNVDISSDASLEGWGGTDGTSHVGIGGLRR